MDSGWSGAATETGLGLQLGRPLPHALRALVMRTVTAAMFVLLTLLPFHSAQAQLFTSQPPSPMKTDENGVDMLSASPTLQSPTVSIGPKGGGLTFNRTWINNDRGWTDPTMTGMSISYTLLGIPGFLSPATISVGTATDMFPPYLPSSHTPPCPTPPNLLSMLGTGATLTFNCSTSLWLYTSHDGTVYALSPSILGYGSFLPTPDPGGYYYGALVSIQRPNGEVVSYHYSAGSRLQSITNNRGYQLKFLYYTNNTSDPSYRLLSGVLGINNSTDYCDPSADACSGFSGNVGPSGTAWPSITYNYSTASGTPLLASETDAAGSVTTYTATNSGLTVTSPAGLVTTVSDGHDSVLASCRA